MPEHNPALAAGVTDRLGSLEARPVPENETLARTPVTIWSRCVPFLDTCRNLARRGLHFTYNSIINES